MLLLSHLLGAEITPSCPPPHWSPVFSTPAPITGAFWAPPLPAGSSSCREMERYRYASVWCGLCPPPAHFLPCEQCVTLRRAVFACLAKNAATTAVLDRPPRCRVMKVLTSIIGDTIKQALVTVVHDGCPAKRVCCEQIEIRPTHLPTFTPRLSSALRACDG